MIQRLLIAGGGTGGHIYPGVAVAEEVLARNPAARVLFIGSAHGLETRVLPRLGYELETITVSRLKGGGLGERLLGLLRIPVGMFQSWRALRRLDPDVVLGVGGYASGPALLAAWLTRRPVAVHEQNASPGLTNRALSRVARAVLTGFEVARDRFAHPERVRFVGNPLRRAVTDALGHADQRPTPPPGRLRLLVFGGSQGARFLNERVPPLLAALRAHSPTLELTVTHQTGAADEARCRTLYAELGLADVATITPYIDDMPAAYAAADLAVCRAGALTIAELTAVGLPAVLVPFPFAADNHQEANARVLGDAGAGRVVVQRDWDEAELVRWLAGLAQDPDQLAAMSRAARALARLDAAQAVVDQLEEVAR